ncbi:hypothetical protein KM043_018494 [Ampulex compressa]|nr:hypothetical protein KM043_018494 [Ampulex compressa]
MIMKSEKQNLRGFKTLWVQFNSHYTDKHQLFFKEHSVRNQELEYPKGKTLFVLNVPPYATEKAIKHGFTTLCGEVSSVVYANSKGFRTAYVIFTKESSLDKALDLSNDSIIILSTKEELCLVGLQKWCNDYNNSITDEDAVKKEIEEYMHTYDEKIAARIAQEKAEEEAAEGDDGWVTVTARKKRGQYALARKESTIQKLQNKEEQRKQKKQLLNFYTFQIRESKKQNLAELRKKFELDKKRLQELKMKRTFKPF